MDAKWQNMKRCHFLKNITGRTSITLWQQHISGFIQRRLDSIFVSNLLQESVNKTEVLASFSADQSSLLFCSDLCKDQNRDKGL